MRLGYSAKFKKQLNKLPKVMRLQVTERLKLFCTDQFHPLLNNHKLAGEYEGRRSINITGDVRLVYRLVDKDSSYLLAVGTHSQLYE